MIIKEFNRLCSWFDKKINKKIYSSEKMVLLQCEKCNSVHFRSASHYKRMQLKFGRLFNKDYCNKCWRPILNNRPEKIKKMRIALKESWQDPKKRQKMSEIVKKWQKRTGYMHGDKNPMKNPETQQKVGKTRSERMTVTERKKYSIALKKAWADGKFIGKKTTQCKWYDYTDQWGNNHKCQGTWELKFARYLDINNIKFISHNGKIPWKDDNGIEHNYYPDFFIPDWKSYVDVKAKYWLGKQKRKFELLKEQTTENIIILTETELLQKGINIYDHRKNN